ncbi:MAG: hypothetical protein K8L97_25205 [Anaerolineae bacterium]|nr:hypothetical protein [Anaerolineae bacterium]
MSLSELDRDFTNALIQWVNVFVLATGMAVVIMHSIAHWLTYKQIIAMSCWLFLGAAVFIYLQSPEGGLNILFSLASAINAGVWAFSGLLSEGV